MNAGELVLCSCVCTYWYKMASSKFLWFDLLPPFVIQGIHKKLQNDEEFPQFLVLCNKKFSNEKEEQID